MSAFIISYFSLVAVATVGGLTYPWVWLWPMLLDAFMCIGSLDVIRRELNSEPTTIAWAVVIGVTLVSTGFNITLADQSVLSWATHALAPVVCFLAFEIEMGVLRSHFRQHDNVSTLSETDRKCNRFSSGMAGLLQIPLSLQISTRNLHLNTRHTLSTLRIRNSGTFLLPFMKTKEHTMQSRKCWIL